MPTPRASPVIYEIDAEDRIRKINKQWSAFARANGAPQLAGTSVLGTCLWDHVTDHATQQIYEVMMKKARAIRNAITVPLRCDGPDRRRFLSLSMRPLANNGIEFEVTTIREQSRPALPLFASGAGQKSPLIRVCSWCKRVATPEWVEAEDAVARLQLFEKDCPPEISHGICPACRKELFDDILRR